ncbi:MAG: methionine--tRNA ligase subunit beta [Crenarchaeota archaeon]|mgnify:CR=1 FL=1|nr:methionine--tRNA ligase subunit beta [Thermoproteota archaeon]
METPPEKSPEKQADNQIEKDVKSTEPEEVTFEDFEKLDFRIGKILEVTPVPKSKKLIQIIVDFGNEKKQAIAGLLQYYNIEELVGKKCVFLVNLKRRMIAGIESQCMILAAEDKEGKISVLFPEKDINEGAKIG